MLMSYHTKELDHVLEQYVPTTTLWVPQQGSSNMTCIPDTNGTPEHVSWGYMIAALVSFAH